jgi:hypothetical protein
MNKKKKIFIINNQEDEDGYNLNPGNSTQSESIRTVLQIYPQNDTAEKRSATIKPRSDGLYISASYAEKK